MLIKETPLKLIKSLLDLNFIQFQILSQLDLEALQCPLGLISELQKKTPLDGCQFARTMANRFQLAMADLELFNVNLADELQWTPQLTKKYLAIPWYLSGNALCIVCILPSIQKAIAKLNVLSSYELTFQVIDIKLFLSLSQSLLANESQPSDYFFNESSEENIIKLVDATLTKAIEYKASDIHFEPYEHYFRIRFRMNGMMQEMDNLPLTAAKQISSRLKILAQMDIAQKRIPQDGRFHFKDKDFRVSTCPTPAGEKVVVRLLSGLPNNLDINNLGLSEQQKTIFMEALQKTQGLILVTGPTGSGKTITLYSALNLLNKSHINIVSVEDPIEIKLAGINQVNINLKAGLTFAKALRSFLRQDPDIIMVGEMRDLETADIGIKAAETGHLVFSTLHTNSAIDALTRLQNIGIANYDITAVTNLIIAQRLLRTLCPFCKEEDALAETILKKTGAYFKNNPHGCQKCQKGFKGRRAIFEMFSLTDDLKLAILKGENALQLLQIAKEAGMLTLREAGIELVKQGKTSLTELNRVIKD